MDDYKLIEFSQKISGRILVKECLASLIPNSNISTNKSRRKNLCTKLLIFTFFKFNTKNSETNQKLYSLFRIVTVDRR